MAKSGRGVMVSEAALRERREATDSVVEIWSNAAGRRGPKVSAGVGGDGIKLEPAPSSMEASVDLRMLLFGGIGGLAYGEEVGGTGTSFEP